MRVPVNVRCAGVILSVIAAALSTSVSPASAQISTAQAAVPLQPSVSFGATSISASGITPGAQAVFFGAGREPHGYSSGILRISAVVRDTDGDGNVTLDIGRAVPVPTVWAVVDLTDGRYAVSAPPGSAVQTATLPPHLLGSSGLGADRLSLDHPFLELLYVQPGLGAWTWSARDGGSNDRDDVGGVTTVDLTDGQNLAGSSELPAHFSTGGVLVAIDWFKLQILAVRLDAALLENK